MPRQNLAVQVLPATTPALCDLPESAEAFMTTVSVFWMRNWDRAIEFGAPSTPTDTPLLEFEKDFRAPEQRHQGSVEVLLVSFGEKFMSTERIRQWGFKNKLYKYIHPRVALALGEDVVPLFSQHITEKGRVVIVSLEPTVRLEGESEKRVCTVYWKRDKYGQVRGELVLDRYGYGWSGDHFIGFDITDIIRGR